MKAYIRTFGCRANHYDSEQIRSFLTDAGVALVDDASEADVAIFNSCAVTADAVADVRQGVRRAAARNPRLRTIVTGCAAAVAHVALSSLPAVSDVIAGADLPRLASALRLRDDVRTARRQSSARALLRIQDGCDEHCTFCVTRIARGGHRSRPLRELLDEARALAEHHPEIVITGTHIGSYGRETGSSLGELLRHLILNVEEVRFRLSSIEASELDDALCGLMRDEPRRLAPHLHAPLQSGSDNILRRMGRSWYDAQSYARAVERLTLGRPVLGVSADVIAGFPGETEVDHQLSMALVERLPFTSLHVFPYSPRPGTAAIRLSDQVPGATIRRRAAELRQLASAKAAAYRQGRAGSTADIVVSGGVTQRTGLTEDYLTVDVDRSVPRGTRFTGVIPA